jgi:cardiolipin synthase (CMP-forming)
MRWIPNALSALRIALVPAWVALAFVERARALDGLEVRRFAVLALIAFIGATDFLDGLIARRYGLTTPTGAALDAVADKLATFAAVTFLAFFGAPAFTAVPIWLWGVLVARDALLGTGYLVLRVLHRHVDASHRWHGRVSTALLFAVVVLACAGGPAALVTVGAVALTALVIPGTVDYLRRGFAQLHHGPAPVAGA